ncbi:MAG: hypothetical protein ACR2NM_08210 [Bythopirellula sp.]
MQRAKFQSAESSDDSFLDVVANVVGVLIILVMLVGAQASRSVKLAESESLPPDSTDELVVAAPTLELAAMRTELDQAKDAVRISHRAIRDLGGKITRLNHEVVAYDQQRVELATHRALLEEDLQRRKEDLAEDKQREFDVQRQLGERKLDLDELNQEQLSLIAAPGEVTEVECVPTPIARLVEGKSIHLRLSKGLVSVVPFEALMDEVQYDIEGTKRRLLQRGRTVETYGPLDGYRLKLTVAQIRSPSSVVGPLVGQSPRIQIGWEAEIIPVSTEIGQNVEQSLLPGGALHKYLMSQRQKKPAVIVWLYTDSFDQFRPLKRALWEMGFSLATRPMKPGTNIKASPRGTRAAAQ